jgi:UPF0176 protein
MAGGMPILGQDHRCEVFHQGVDIRDNSVALGHSERAAGAKIVLDVDDEEGVGHGLLRHSRLKPTISDLTQGCKVGLDPSARQDQNAAMYTIAALYHFTRIDDPSAARGPLLDLCKAQGVNGTLLLAREGINGTIAGSRAGIAVVLAHLRALPGFADLVHKESAAGDAPFIRMKVRLKKEIVTMGQPDVDPRASVGAYVDPVDWNDLISAPDVAVIDTRNDYEVGIGTFKGAVDPQTDTFREFPAWWEKNKDRFHNKRIAMFCTGGIRCEKSTNYLIGLGVEDVFHLKGGILKYLEKVPQDESLWEGSCFVFDGRVSVDHGLAEGPHILCHACRRPLLPEDRLRPEFEQGVSCHQCAHDTTDERKAAFRERQKQMALAEQRGERHIGPA